MRRGSRNLRRLRSLFGLNRRPLGRHRHTTHDRQRNTGRGARKVIKTEPPQRALWIDRRGVTPPERAKISGGLLPQGTYQVLWGIPFCRQDCDSRDGCPKGPGERSAPRLCPRSRAKKASGNSFFVVLSLRLYASMSSRHAAPPVSVCPPLRE
jgi:hypothetical protein